MTIRHEPNKGFSFELPDGWRRDERNLQIAFHGPESSPGSSHQIIQVQVGGILPQYHPPENREKFLSEPGATVARTEVGGERNAVILVKPTNSEISVVRDGIQYSFAYGHDAQTLRAIELVKRTTCFPTQEVASSEIRTWSDPKYQAIAGVLRAESPEEARGILTRAGAQTVRRPGLSIHDLNSIGDLHGLGPTEETPRTKSKRWWQFWK